MGTRLAPTQPVSPDDPATAAEETAAPERSTPKCRTMRADARRNYDALLVSAERIFAKAGSDASLDEIARDAGVGIGTLYRHFPTRQDLVETVYLRRLDDLRTAAAQLEDAESPFDAFADWLRRHLEFGRRGRCMAASAMAGVSAKKMQEGTELNRAVNEMRAAGGRLLVRAQETGTIRPDVDLGDLIHMVHGILMVNEGHEDSVARSERMLALVIDGLRP